MNDQAFSSHFGDFGEAIWLDTAHQGALPIVAADAAREAIGWKVQPSRLPWEQFEAVPGRLRHALSRLLNAPEGEITLANSASYGLHLIANAVPWREGDEILVMDGDFPSDILPWLAVSQRTGARVIRIKPRDRVIAQDELEAALSPRTKLFCTTWVHSFSGRAVDLIALGTICRDRGVLFVVNGSQVVGTRPTDVSALPIDALTGVGFKWLCGPYGTGFLWLSQRLMDRMHRPKAYWLTMLTKDDLAGDPGELRVGPISSARDLDIFGTANFFNFTAFATAVEVLLDLRIEAIADHDQYLVDSLLDGLASTRYRLISAFTGGDRRSTLIVLDHQDPAVIGRAFEALGSAHVSVAKRSGAIRISPHLYNSKRQIDYCAEVLRTAEGV